MFAYVVNFVHFAFEIYYLLILANILLSWFPMRPNAVTSFIYDMTEPYLALFRRMLPISPRFPVDFSPIIAIFVLYVLESLLMRLLVLLV